MGVNFIKKVQKLYRIQDAFIKYNIFDINAFQNDSLFSYILENYQIENTNSFHTYFTEKYKNEIIHSNAYQQYESQIKSTEKNSEDNIENEKRAEIEEENEEEIEEENEEDFVHNERKSNQNDLKCKEITIINKKMFKQIIFLCHPDKSLSNDKVLLFNSANEYMKKSYTIGLINCCCLLNLDLCYIDYDNETFKEYCYPQMREVIQEIIQLYNLRK